MRTSAKRKKDTDKLYRVLLKQPMSRRMAATALGYDNQTYMVTQTIFDWLKNGRAISVGKRRCVQSLEMVEFVTTNLKKANK